MKPLTLEETRLKEEMKQDCFWDNIHYKNPEAEKAFNLICHLEDFEIQYWELQQENEQLKANWNKLKEIVKSQSSLKQKCHNESLWFEVDELLSKMQELESSDVDE